MNDNYYRECLEHNAVAEVERRFCRHDLQHMLDVARITYMLVLEDACQKGHDTAMLTREIIYAAGLLHDLARWLEYETGEDHAVAGARLAGPVLDRSGFNDREKEVILTAIREHRAGAEEKTSSLGRYMARADDLSRPCYNCKARNECYKIGRMETSGNLLY
ncbi:HD domain-containing protein [Desulfotruncus alcoholivorax]|uniref:HD domain-containing protein n=1 Tax=Desulfotruncus alcoholivorax TaxID=265477 RepID=UPI001EE5FA84|nr:HD domain-containing protein [Desulfotruncus alcoholivorax]